MDDPKAKKPEMTAPPVSQPPRDGAGDTHALEAELAGLRAENSRLKDQARAAQGTAAELTKSNEMLRRSASALAGIQSLDDFLSETLAAAIVTTGAQNGAVVLAQGDVAEYVVLMEGTARVPRTRQEREGTCSFPITPELRAHMERMQDTGDIWAPLPDDALHPTAFVAYHRARGNKAIRNVPLMVGRRVIGWLGFGFAQAEPPAAWQVELLRALAEQTTVAVELSRLAEEAKEAAAAKEREAATRQRAAELAKANEALSRSINGLTSFQDLQSFLTSVLREAIAASGSVSGAVFVHEPAADTLRIVAHVLRGEIIDVDRDPRNAEFRSSFPSQKVPLWEIICHERRVCWIDRADPVHDHWPLAKAFHDANGHRFVACIPMLLGDKTDGILWLAFDAAESLQPAEARLELSRVLAQQGTLALRLSQLTEQVHQAAIARAREQSARERAAELDRANEALRRSVAKLAGACELSDFFTHALVATAEAVGAASAGLRRFDPARRTFQLFRHVADGRELPIGDEPQHRQWHLDDPVIAEAWRAMTTGDCFLWCDPTGPEIHPDTQAWHETQEHRAVAMVPMQRGDDFVGLVALGFRSDARPTQAQVELTQALVQQLTLAAELERLAEESKQTAIFRERERAARQRTAELAKANEALQWTTDRLARKPQLEDYLGYVLLDACEHVRAAGGCLHIHDPVRLKPITTCERTHEERAPARPASQANYSRPH
jgi:GAF domain-containing protein